MKIFLLTFNEPTSYDETSAVVAIAANEAEARAEVARSNVCGDECGHLRQDRGEAASPCAWTDPELAKCEEIGTANVSQGPGVVLRDFHAG